MYLNWRRVIGVHWEFKLINKLITNNRGTKHESISTMNFAFHFGSVVTSIMTRKNLLNRVDESNQYELSTQISN